MEQINFNFKKTRGFGDLIQDYISLFKIIFKHLNARIISIAMPFMAVFILIAYYLTTVVNEIMKSAGDLGVMASLAFVPIVLLLLIFLFFILISAFAIEYMFLLEERRDLDFTSSDIYNRIKENAGKYIRFFLSSIVVGIGLLFVIGILGMVFNLIPLVGRIAIGIVTACMTLFIYCALFLYRQDREDLWGSYGASFRLIKGKILEYGAATYAFQVMIQIVMVLIAFIPLIIIGIIAFTTVGFSAQFFDGFLGKFLATIGGSIFMLFLIFFSFYMIGFYVLQYFSLLESSYKEDTLEQIDQIGGTADEF